MLAQLHLCINSGISIQIKLQDQTDLAYIPAEGYYGEALGMNQECTKFYVIETQNVQSRRKEEAQSRHWKQLSGTKRKQNYVWQTFQHLAACYKHKNAQMSLP